MKDIADGVEKGDVTQLTVDWTVSDLHRHQGDLLIDSCRR